MSYVIYSSVNVHIVEFTHTHTYIYIYIYIYTKYIQTSKLFCTKKKVFSPRSHTYTVYRKTQMLLS